MTPADLRVWQQSLGLTQAGAAMALGVSLATYKRWLTGSVPQLVALACEALAANTGGAEWTEFEPWAEYVGMNTGKDDRGYYASLTTDMAWQAWEMAKHRITCVQPPSHPRYSHPH